MKQKRAYHYRIYPTAEQAMILARTFGCVRYVYNWALRVRTDAYYQQGKRLYYSDLSCALTDLKKQEATAWLNEVSSVPLQQSLRHLDKAFLNFFEGRAEYPTFHKKHGKQSATYAASAFKWDGTSLTLAKMETPLTIAWSRPLPKDCKPTTVTISKDCAGRYFVSILIEEEIKPLPVINAQVGIDLGLKSMVIFSTGETVGNPKFFAKDEKKLARAQRRVAKKKKGSKNRNKARRKVARIHARIADRRRDYQQKLSTRIIRENQIVCIESLSVKNMIKNDKWYPSSRRCFDCGHVLDSLSLDVREWTCPECAVVHDRDVNAAHNILAAGLAVHACGESIRPGAVKANPGTTRRSRKPSQR